MSYVLIYPKSENVVIKIKISACRVVFYAFRWLEHVTGQHIGAFTCIVAYTLFTYVITMLNYFNFQLISRS